MPAISRAAGAPHRVECTPCPGGDHTRAKAPALGCTTSAAQVPQARSGSVNGVPGVFAAISGVVVAKSVRAAAALRPWDATAALAPRPRSSLHGFRDESHWYEPSRMAPLTRQRHLRGHLSFWIAALKVLIRDFDEVGLRDGRLLLVTSTGHFREFHGDRSPVAHLPAKSRPLSRRQFGYAPARLHSLYVGHSRRLRAGFAACKGRVRGASGRGEAPVNREFQRL